MTKFNSKHKALSALTSLRVVALITATTLALLFVGCKQTGTGGSGSGGGNGGGDKPKPSTPNNYSIAFSVEGTQSNGTLKAKADGIDETDKSPISVEEGKTVTFTATPSKDYQIKGWTFDGNAVNGTNTSYTHTVSKPATITVSFELIPKAILTLTPDNLTITVTAKTADGSDITVEGCTKTTFASGKPTSLTAKEGTTKVVLKGNIIELECSYSQLTAIDVQGLKALQKLSCPNNKLTSLNVQGLATLKNLNCSYNQIPELNVQGYTSLQMLECYRNKLSKLNVQGCTSLENLQCYHNELSSLDVQGLTSLKELFCYSNNLTSLNVQGCTSLQELQCWINNLATLNVQGLKALQKLWCFYNKLTVLDAQGLTSLQDLSCYKNQLAELGVQGCTALKELKCHDNKLNADAFIKIFTDLPQREASEKAKASLYLDDTDEENNKDFTQPEPLQTAFEKAKNTKHWTMQKYKGGTKFEEI